MTTLGRRVTIGPLNYTLVFDDEIVKDHLESTAEIVGDGDEELQTRTMVDLATIGVTDQSALVMAVASGHRDTMAVTALHEILHAMLAVAGVQDTLTSEQEESIVERLGPLLYWFLRDNRDLIDVLLSAEEHVLRTGTPTWG